MKNCPFCAEEILDNAIKCKHCGEFITQKPKVPWYSKTSSMVLAFITVGPLALPLVWFHSSYSRNKKIIITFIVLIVSIYLGKAVLNSIQVISSSYNMLSNM